MSLVLDFIKGAAEDIANPIAKVGNEVGALGENLGALGEGVIGNNQEMQNLSSSANRLLNPGGGLLHQGGVLNAQQTQGTLNAKDYEKIAGTGAEIGTNFIGGGAAEDIAKQGGKKLTLDFIKSSAKEGATAGGAAGGIYTAGNEAANGQNLNPGQIAEGTAEGVGAGAILGPTIGAGKAALENRIPLNEAGAVGNNIPKPSDQFSQEDLQKMAESNDPKAVAKQLEPVTGEVVAQQIAPSVAHTTDPNSAANIIDNAVNKKVSPAVPSMTPDTTGATQPLPSPEPLPVATSVSDVNTPQQVQEQGSVAEANYNPQQQTQPTPEEASLYNKEPEPAFMNKPGEPPTPSKVGKAGVISEMANMINTGQHTNDEILNHYFETVPSATASEAHDAFDQAANSVGVDKSKINASLNPQTDKVQFAPVSANDDSGALLNGRYTGEKVGQFGAPVVKDMEALDAHDRELTRYLRGKNPDEVQAIQAQAHDQSTFADYIKDAKDYNDYTQAAGAKLGQPLPYRVNYGGRTPYDPPEGIPGHTNDSAPAAGQPTNAAYTKQRYFNTHEEALANGYSPLNEDPLDDIKMDINQRAGQQTRLALAQGYEQAYPGQVKIINNPEDPIPSGYRQLLVTGGRSIYLPDSIAEKINNQVMTKTPGKLLGKYDTINQAGKQVELSGGTFHGVNTAGTFVGQQIASGKALTDMGATAKVVSNFFSDAHMQSYLDDYSKTPSGGVDENHSIIDGAKATGLNIKNTSVDLESPGEKSLSGKIANIPVLKQIHEAVFDRQIPTMMLETFRQKTEGLDIFGNADDRLQGEKIAKQINKEFGVIDHDIDGLTAQQFKIAGRFMLAPGYQEGQIRTLLDAVSKGGAEGKLAREAVFGKALLFGGLATAGSAAGGDFNGQSPKQVALGILNKAINPSFDIGGYKVSTPATQISDLGKPIEQTVSGFEKGKGAATGIENFASSHAAFIPGKAEQLATNKNYEGNAIYGKDYYGRPISPLTTAENVGSGVLPIPAAQGEAQATGQQNTAASIANTIGFNAHPQGNTEYAPIAMQTYLQQLQQTPDVTKQQLSADTQFTEALSQGTQGRSTAKKDAEKALIAGDNSKAVQIMDNYNKQLSKSLQSWVKSGGENYLDDTMVGILQQSTLTYGNISGNISYDLQTNPTAYGAQVKGLSSAPKPINSGGQ